PKPFRLRKFSAAEAEKALLTLGQIFVAKLAAIGSQTNSKALCWAEARAVTSLFELVPIGFFRLLGVKGCPRPLIPGMEESPRRAPAKARLAWFPPECADFDAAPAKAAAISGPCESKKMPLLTCDTSLKTSTLVEALPELEVKLKPFSLLADQVT